MLCVRAGIRSWHGMGLHFSLASHVDRLDCVGQKLANGHVDLELLRFPLVSVTEHAKLTDAERAEVMQALDQLVAQHSRHGVILDLRLAQPLPDEQRGLITRHFHAHSDAIAEKWAALAVVVRTPLLDNLPTGAFWVRASPVPTKVFTSVDEASAWLRACLTQRASTELGVLPALADSKRHTS